MARCIKLLWFYGEMWCMSTTVMASVCGYKNVHEKFLKTTDRGHKEEV